MMPESSMKAIPTDTPSISQCRKPSKSARGAVYSSVALPTAKAK